MKIKMIFSTPRGVEYVKTATVPFTSVGERLKKDVEIEAGYHLGSPAGHGNKFKDWRVA